MPNIQYHYNRRPRNFLHRKVRDALPEFFTQDYPKLVTFLEKYYDYLDSDGASSFDYLMRVRKGVAEELEIIKTIRKSNLVTLVTFVDPENSGALDAMFELDKL